LPPHFKSLEHDPEKLALGLDPGVETGFPKKIMLQQKLGALIDSIRNDCALATPANSLVHATIELAFAAVGALSQEVRPRRPGDHVGQRAAIAIAMVVLRVAKCHKRTIALRQSRFRAARK
jgi:hypothetical protein